MLWSYGLQNPELFKPLKKKGDILLLFMVMVLLRQIPIKKVLINIVKVIDCVFPLLEMIN